MKPSPYWCERMAEELWHLQRMPGLNKRRDPATLARLAQIDNELRQSAKEGGRRTRPRGPNLGV